MLYAFGGNGGCGYGGSYLHMGPRWFGGFYGGGFMMIITTVLIGLLIFAGFKYFYKNGSEKPLDILKLRYSRGEITKEEFDSMKNDLSQL